MKFLSDQDRKILNDFISTSMDNTVAFIGAGISHGEPTNFPLWNEVIDLLIDRARRLYPAKSQDIDTIEKLKEIDDINTKLNVFENLKKLLTEGIYNSEINKIFNADDVEYPHILEDILTKKFSGIITTNIDCLIENAHHKLVADGLLNQQIHTISTFDNKAASEITHTKNWLWKIHGTIANPDTWIFTLSEYYKKEYSGNYIESLLNIFHNKRVVFIGYSAKDIDLLFMLDKLKERYGTPRISHILLTRDSSEFDLALYAQYGIEVVSYGGDENHNNLKKVLQMFPKKKQK